MTDYSYPDHLPASVRMPFNSSPWIALSHGSATPDIRGTDASLDELRGLASMLPRWWTALDTLDGYIGGDGTYDTPASLDAQVYRQGALHEFFTARQRLLFAVAAQGAIPVHRPEHDSGEIETSSHAAGWFGYSDPLRLAPVKL